MRRAVSDHLDAWLRDPARLPLVVRGARQVGKTWLVRDLAARSGLDLVEVNLERDPAVVRCFAAGASPSRILEDLALVLGRDIRPGRSLLFLDEVQAHGPALATLRWFAESHPDLAVVAAGSLLEFVLADHSFSMPVGRVTYVHLGPLTFAEFLEAHAETRLHGRLVGWTAGADLGAVVHTQALSLWRRFLNTGGLPAAVAADVAGAGAATVRRLQTDLAATYRDDFPKYAGRVDPHLLDAVLRSAVLQLGSRFVYTQVGEGLRHELARRALELLARARLCHLVPHTAANGLPLGAEANPRLRKVLLLDLGLVHALLGTPPATAEAVWDRLPPRTRGQIAEQAVGQELLALRDPWTEPSLHYWQRSGGRPGEIDFLISLAGRVVPVETKAGTAGSLKSLHQFVHDKALDLAVRCDANPPSVQEVDLRTTTGDRVRFTLLNVPPYLLWRLREGVTSAGSRRR